MVVVGRRCSGFFGAVRFRRLVWHTLVLYSASGHFGEM